MRSSIERIAQVSFRRRAGGGRRDAIEAEIVQELERVGASVKRLGGTGNPDLLVRFGAKWLPLEVKSGKRGRLTRNQWGLEWPVVRSVEEALTAIGVRP